MNSRTEVILRHALNEMHRISVGIDEQGKIGLRNKVFSVRDYQIHRIASGEKKVSLALTKEEENQILDLVESYLEDLGHEVIKTPRQLKITAKR